MSDLKQSNDNYQKIRGCEYYNEVPEAIIEIKRVSDRGIWVVGESGKEYLVPHHTIGKSQESTLKELGIE